ncbi:MAG: SAM-dependent methyltransferase [Methanocalculaceae archaeon]|jgi:tRNA wybutosine-synthesizing protein 2|nr:SAM-dependent methyltransferase [Methanocalculaceae archaeon]
MRIRKVLKSRLLKYRTELWVDAGRRIYCAGEYAYVPVADGWPYDFDLPERKPYSGPGYQRLGDTLLLHRRVSASEELESLVAWEHPACVLLLNHHDGVMRQPEVSVLYGEPHDVTFHEFGIHYTLNPAKLMFSQGNRSEKQRLRSLVRPGERIADMFAGIGYFALPAALAGANVHAMEINPVSCAYLRRNVEANGVADRITISCGNCRTLLNGVYHRFLMGHFAAPEFLPDALDHAESGTILHVHGIGDSEAEILAAVERAGFSYSLSKHKVKKYASHTWHGVWDVELT